jgi:signal transduction histidine kinase
MLRDFRIGLRLGIGFVAIFSLLAAFGLFGIYRMHLLSEQTQLIYNHPLAVSNAVLRIDTNIIKMHRTMKDVALAGDIKSIEADTEIVDYLEQKVLEDFEIISERFLGDKTKHEAARRLFVNWKPIRDEVIGLMKQGRKAEAAGITKGKGARHVQKMEEAIEGLGDFAQKKATDFLRTAERVEETSIVSGSLVFVIVIIIGIAFAIYMTRSITRPLRALSAGTDRVGRGQLDTVIDIDSRDEIGSLADSFNRMTSDLKLITASRDELDSEIAERKAIEKMLVLNKNRLEALNELNARHNDSEQEIGAYALEYAIALTESRIGFIGKLNGAGDVYSIYAWSKNVMAECDVSDKTLDFPIDKAGIWAESIRQNRPIIINDYNAQDPISKGLPEGHVPLKRIMSVPIVRGNRVTVAATVGNKERDYDDSDVLQLSLLLDGLWKNIERKRAEEELGVLAENLRLSNRELEHFAAIASHDLQSPLISIHSALRLIEMDIGDRAKPETMDYIDTSRTSITNMLESIRRLLDYSRLDSSGKRDFRAVNVGYVLEQAIVKLNADIEQSGTTVTYDNMPEEVFGDSTLLVLLFQNLINNSIKSKAEEPLRIHVSSCRGERGLVFSVSDNGVGITPERKEDIFEIFSYLRERKGIFGSGIGLSTCRKIVELHGGDIWVESEPGAGATFHFTLPKTEDVQS